MMSHICSICHDLGLESICGKSSDDKAKERQVKTSVLLVSKIFGSFLCQFTPTLERPSIFSLAIFKSPIALFCISSGASLGKFTIFRT